MKKQSIKYYKDGSKKTLTAVLGVIRQYMHADGHSIFPVIVGEEDETAFAFRSIQTKDGKVWNAAFTSQAEFEKGVPSRVISDFIDSAMKFCLESETDGFIINPLERLFMFAKKLIEMIFEADDGAEYSVPDDPITREPLEDEFFLKRAMDICNRNRTATAIKKPRLRTCCIFKYSDFIRYCSVVEAKQVQTIDKDWLIRRIGHLDARNIAGIEDAVRNYFGFDNPDCIEAS